jgi:16S rRNA (uracil1498-N3)-methyltransferase
MHTFFTQNISNEVTLSEIESKHAVKVLRLVSGNNVRLIDGKGTEAFGSVSNAHHKHCQIQVESIIQKEKPTHEIAVALAPTKSNDRTEWFLEKAIEIGITHFIPIICENSERKKFNTERWNKVAISAMKQSQRLWLPKISLPIKMDEFVKENICEIRLIAHCEKGDKQELTSYCDNSKDQLIIIGPEGDFSPNEIELALNNSFTPVSLGDNRLRTETAGIVACTIMKFQNKN